MALHVTPLYAGLLGALYLWLMQRVVARRRALWIDMGSGDDALLLRYIRGHANFAEYAPLMLVMLALLELGGWPFWLLHLLGLATLMGRILHAYAFSVAELRQSSRTAGMVLTFGALGVMAALCIVQAFR